MSNVLFSPKVLELIGSRMCHDLISPVGAVSNGVELMTELGPDAGEEAVALIASSIEQANRRLKVFRMAYGAAGAAPGLDPRDVRGAIVDYFQGGRIACDWTAEDALALKAVEELPIGLLKGVLLSALLIGETIRKDGDLTIGHEITDSSVIATITAKGEGVNYHEGVEAALGEDVDVDGLTPRSVHAYITPRYVTHYGGEFSCKQDGGTITATVTFKL